MHKFKLNVNETQLVSITMQFLPPVTITQLLLPVTTTRLTPLVTLLLSSATTTQLLSPATHLTNPGEVVEGKCFFLLQTAHLLAPDLSLFTGTAYSLGLTVKL